MDLNRLLQGIGGRLLRQAIGMLLKKGVSRLGGPATPRNRMTPTERARHEKTAQMQKRLGDVMKVGRRFWR